MDDFTKLGRREEAEAMKVADGEGDDRSQWLWKVLQMAVSWEEEEGGSERRRRMEEKEFWKKLVKKKKRNFIAQSCTYSLQRLNLGEFQLNYNMHFLNS